MMKRLFRSIRAHALCLVLALDALVLGIFYYFIPGIPRPFEVLMAIATVLAVLTAVVSPKAWLRGAAVVVASVTFSVFVLELAQKYFDIMNLLEGRTEKNYLLGEAGDYSWNRRIPSTYLRTREKAWRDGVIATPLEDGFVGDIFADVDKSGLVTRETVVRSRNRRQFSISLKPGEIRGEPFGYELTPDNVTRFYGNDTETGGMMYDVKATTDSYGLRTTRGGGPDSDAYLFLGCSYTYGLALNDDETMPHYFSEAFGFGKKVLNTAVSGYGPHQALRELELDYHAERAGLDPEQVKAVFFLLIDDHAHRVVRPNTPMAPYYELENGRAVFKGPFLKTPHLGRLFMMMEKSRIYPILRERLTFDTDSTGLSEQWIRTLAVVKEMDRLCREKYGVPLTLTYWGKIPAVLQRLREMGIETLVVDDAFEKDWERFAIRYYIYDGHPSAHANRLLGRMLHRHVTEGDNASQ